MNFEQCPFFIELVYLYRGPYFEANVGPAILGLAIISIMLPLIPFGKSGPGTFDSLRNALKCLVKNIKTNNPKLRVIAIILKFKFLVLSCLDTR